MIYNTLWLRYQFDRKINLQFSKKNMRLLVSFVYLLETGRELLDLGMRHFSKIIIVLIVVEVLEVSK